MKYFGRLIMLVPALLLGAWVNAGTVTVNGINCGNTTGNVTIDGSGNVLVSTDNPTACAPGGGGGGTGPWTLSVSRNGTGTGTVSGGGINCGTTCSASFDNNTVVNLTATPAGTDVFAGWSGACTGTGSCSVTMISAKSVTATFNTAGGGGGGDCPVGVTCVDATDWPTISQKTYSMKQTDVLAVRIRTTTTSGITGAVKTNYTTGSTASREMALTNAPASFSVSSYRCSGSGLEQAEISWKQGTSTLFCGLPLGTTVWLNIRFTNCPANTVCNFTLSGRSP